MSATALIFVGNDSALNEKAQKMLFKAGFSWPISPTVFKDFPNLNVLVLEASSITWLDETGYSPMVGLGGLAVNGVDRLPILIAATMTQEEVNALPFANPKPKVEVRELTMEQLNELSQKTFGYQIKIRK